MVLHILIQGIRSIIDVTDSGRRIDDAIQGLEDVDTVNIGIATARILRCICLTSDRFTAVALQCIRLL